MPSTWQEARRFDQQGYVRFRHWRIYGERGLAGEHGAVRLYGENLTIHFTDDLLARYIVAYERDQKNLKTVADPRLFETEYQSPQRWLWERPPDDWQLVLRLPDYAPRRRAILHPAIQLVLFEPECESASQDQQA